MSDLDEARRPARTPNRHCRLAILGRCCRYHSHRRDGCLQRQRTGVWECPCVARSRALGIVLPHRPLRDVCP
jgi:hypothetical protein